MKKAKERTIYKKESHCPCGSSCLTCTAQELSVTCGCTNEALQFEYNIKKQLQHELHKSEDLCSLSHLDHEAAMSGPTMMKHMEQDMRRRFLLSLFFTIPVMLYEHIGPMLNVNIPSIIPTSWLLFILSSVLVFGPASIFFAGAYNSLKTFNLNMSVLLALGIGTSYLFSIFLLLTGSLDTFFDATAMLISTAIFGHLIEMRSRRGTSTAMRALFNLIPPRSTVMRNEKPTTIPTSEIKIDDIVVIKPGEKIPVDGIVVQGESEIDMSMVTGESIPVLKKPKDAVIAGSINTTTVFQMRATKIGADTVLAHIIKLVEEAQQSKSSGQRLADIAAQHLTVTAIGSGLIAFIWWYIFAKASLTTAISFAASAVVVACPDALGLATPLAVAVATGIAARRGILYKNALVLEQAAKITAVLLDKTGTITEGHPVVTDIITLSQTNKNELLFYSGSAQQFSDHPLSKAIVAAMKKERVTPTQDVEAITAIAGQGIKATVAGIPVLAGSLKFIENEGFDTSFIEKDAIELTNEGKSITVVTHGDKAIGILATQDPIKQGVEATINQLKKRNIHVTMVTGDHKTVAHLVAKNLGIEDVFAEVKPQDKAECVKKLQEKGYFVAMVGDGINDAPALATANIGIAIGAGTDVALQTADVILMRSNPLDILTMVDLSKATVKKMMQNLIWAASYNLFTIPIAAGVLYTTWGITLRPELAALLMSSSTIIVTLNALRLNAFTPAHIKKQS